MGRIVVAGAGIGGLCAAHAIRRAGYDAVVLERSPQLSTVGAGLGLWPNAVHALDWIGAGEEVRQIGSHVKRSSLTDRRGRELGGFDFVSISARMGAPMLVVERPALHAILARGLDIRTNAAVESADEHGVTLDTGEQIEADAVVGADGVGSAVRAYVAPEARVVETGKIGVRAIAPMDLGEDLLCESWGTGDLFGAASLPGGRTFWYYVTARPDFQPTRAFDELRQVSHGWAGPYRELVESSDPRALLVHPIRTVTRPRQWSRGTVTLLGDAAHAMEPNLGQGAAQAIEDAVDLGRALFDGEPVVGAFAAYARRRGPLAHRVQRESARMARMAHSVRMVAVRNALLRVTPSTLGERRMLSLLAS
jgi:2-polyprenyl-6-methoxyphenol hydroxylase-like FAD-dependent oxidoreductase